MRLRRFLNSTHVRGKPTPSSTPAADELRLAVQLGDGQTALDVMQALNDTWRLRTDIAEQKYVKLKVEMLSVSDGSP